MAIAPRAPSATAMSAVRYLWRSPDHHLADDGTRLERVFEVLRGHILAARSDDDVLLPVRDAQVPVAVQFPDVSRVEPPFRFDGFRGRFWTAGVTLHDAAAADENLAVRADLELHSGNGRSHRADLVPGGAVHAGGGAGFGQTEAFQDLYARQVEEVGDLPGQGRAARDEPAQPPSESLGELRAGSAAAPAACRSREKAICSRALHRARGPASPFRSGSSGTAGPGCQGLSCPP